MQQKWKPKITQIHGSQTYPGHDTPSAEHDHAGSCVIQDGGAQM